MTVYTIEGDTWDTVARRVYGNERRAMELMQARENIRLLDIEVFPGGVAIFAPELPQEDDTSDLPEWRR